MRGSSTKIFISFFFLSKKDVSYLFFTGNIQLISELDRERRSSYSIVVVASDKGSPPLSSAIPISITVQDAIDSPPYFQPLVQTIDILENAVVNSVIFTISARDDDLNDTITYNMTYASRNDTFLLDGLTGDVKLLKTLDRETELFYRLRFKATDSVGLVSDNDGLVVELNVIDVNDHVPFFLNEQCSTEVTQDYPDRSIIFIVNAQDNDAGRNAELTYDLSANAISTFAIDPKLGVVTKSGSFSPFVSSSIDFNVTVSDNGSPKLSSSISCSVKVLETNKDAPKFSQTVYNVTVPENTPVGEIMQTFQASGKSQLSYKLIGGQGLLKIFPQNVS